MILKLKERKCSTCGKRFILREGWVFKRTSGNGEKLFCSWGCMRKWDKEHGKKEFRNEAIQLALAQGLSVDEVAKKLNEDKTKVRYWARKQGVENEVSQQKDGS